MNVIKKHPVRKYIDAKGYEGKEMIQIINEWHFMQTHGQIGDCFLRDNAEDYIKEMCMPPNIVMVMREFAECAYQFFAMAWFEQNDMINEIWDSDTIMKMKQ